MEEPAASPSRPSVMFTALEDAVRTMKAQSRNTSPRCTPVTRRNDRFVELPVTDE